jgi:predicted short-subunit dehydrogenase-like oxidoreductase (DUF2520 family)
MPKTIAVIGAGRVGTAFALLLNEKGYHVSGIADIEQGLAEKCARRIASAAIGAGATPIATTDPSLVAGGADIVLITTPDREIGPVARELAGRERGSGTPSFSPGTVLCHASGALASTVLRVEGLEHVSVLSLHPLQTFADEETAPARLAGSLCVLEGDAHAVAVGKQLVQDIGGKAFVISTHHHTAYHAAACIASNYLVALLHLAGVLFARIGMERDESLEALLPLVRSTLDNISLLGIPEALTGPIERGDISVVETHLAALDEDPDPLLQAAYAILGRICSALAVEKGRITRDEQRRFDDLFDSALSASGLVPPAASSPDALSNESGDRSPGTGTDNPDLSDPERGE